MPCPPYTLVITVISVAVGQGRGSGFERRSADARRSVEDAGSVFRGGPAVVRRGRRAELSVWTLEVQLAACNNYN